MESYCPHQLRSAGILYRVHEAAFVLLWVPASPSCSHYALRAGSWGHQRRCPHSMKRWFIIYMKFKHYFRYIIKILLQYYFLHFQKNLFPMRNYILWEIISSPMRNYILLYEKYIILYIWEIIILYNIIYSCKIKWILNKKTMYCLQTVTWSKVQFWLCALYFIILVLH